MMSSSFHPTSLFRFLSAFVVLAFCPALVLSASIALKVITERPYPGGTIEIYLRLLGDPANELTVHANYHLYNTWTEVNHPLKFLSMNKEESETPEEAHLFFEVPKDLKTGTGPEWVVRAISPKGKLLTETFSFEISPPPIESERLSETTTTPKTIASDSPSPSSSHVAPKLKASSTVENPFSWRFEDLYPQQAPIFDRAPML